MKLNINITAQDCADGCRGTERYCVVATAIARQVPEANRIEVNIDTIRFTMPAKASKKTTRYAYDTPTAVREYIRRYDAGEDPKPMRFVLDHPQITEKSPTPKGRAKAPSRKPQGDAVSRRSVRVFGAKTFQRVDA